MTTVGAESVFFKGGPALTDGGLYPWAYRTGIINWTQWVIKKCGRHEDGGM